MFGNDNDALDALNQSDNDKFKEKNSTANNANAAAAKKGLQIDIDENLDFDQQNEVAQQLLDEKVTDHEKKLAQGENAQEVDNESLMSDMPEEAILAMFDELFRKDEALRHALGDTADYNISEKLSIL